MLVTSDRKIQCSGHETHRATAPGITLPSLTPLLPSAWARSPYPAAFPPVLLQCRLGELPRRCFWSAWLVY